MTNLNNELKDNELDAVTGGGAIVDAMGAAKAIGAAEGAIVGINNILEKTVDAMPVSAPRHPN